MQSPHPPEWDMLLSAAQKNRPDIIKELIEIGGVPASHANGVGQSALHIAALWGHVESVQALIDGGANINAQNDMTGATPLHMVAQSRKGTVENRIAVIDILLAAGANVAQADNYGLLPVHALQINPSSRSENESDELTRRFTANLQPKRSEIQDAIVERDASKMKELLVKDPSAANSKLAVVGLTPVEYVIEELFLDASSSGNQGLVQILQELLSSGGDPNGKTTKDEKSAVNAALIGEIKEAPLHKVVLAIRSLEKSPDDDNNDREEQLGTVVDMLVTAGATVTPDTTQLLHQAARRNDVTFARFLVERLKIDPNSKGRQGMTPLHFAARSGQLEMVHFLLKQPGIEVHPTDDRGKTPLDGAQVNQKDEVVEVLKNQAS